MYTLEQQQDDKRCRIVGASITLIGLGLTVAMLAIIFNARGTLMPQGDDVMRWFGLCVCIAVIAIGIYIIRLPDHQQPQKEFPGWD